MRVSEVQILLSPATSHCEPLRSLRRRRNTGTSQRSLVTGKGEMREHASRRFIECFAATISQSQ